MTCPEWASGRRSGALPWPSGPAPAEGLAPFPGSPWPDGRCFSGQLHPPRAATARDEPVRESKRRGEGSHSVTHDPEGPSLPAVPRSQARPDLTWDHSSGALLPLPLLQTPPGLSEEPSGRSHSSRVPRTRGPAALTTVPSLTRSLGLAHGRAPARATAGTLGKDERHLQARRLSRETRASAGRVKPAGRVLSGRWRLLGK